MCITTVHRSVDDPEIVKGGGAEDSVSALSSFFANAHNELYALLYVERRLIDKKIWANSGEGRPPPPHPTFEFATV